MIHSEARSATVAERVKRPGGGLKSLTLKNSFADSKGLKPSKLKHTRLEPGAMSVQAVRSLQMRAGGGLVSFAFSLCFRGVAHAPHGRLNARPVHYLTWAAR